MAGRSARYRENGQGAVVGRAMADLLWIAQVYRRGAAAAISARQGGERRTQDGGDC